MFLASGEPESSLIMQDFILFYFATFINLLYYLFDIVFIY